MIYTKLTKRALEVAMQAHKDQTDPAGFPYIFQGEIGVHGAAYFKDAGTGRIDANVPDQYLGIRGDERSHNKESGGGDISRHLNVLAMQCLWRGDGAGVSF